MSDSSLDFFAELEGEIARHVAKDKLRRDRNNARKRANTMTLPQSERAKASATFRELNKLVEAEEWAAVSTVALFHEQTCDGCGSTHLIFLQYMECQALKKRPSTQRWIRITRPAPEAVLPRETLLQPTTTHICSHCCEDHGFGLISASRLAPRPDAFIPSTNYLQEDINAPAI